MWPPQASDSRLRESVLSLLLPQAEEEFNKAQSVFEDLNQELLEELPVLYHR